MKNLRRASKGRSKWQIKTVHTIIRNSAYFEVFVHNKCMKVKISGRENRVNTYERSGAYNMKNGSFLREINFSILVKVCYIFSFINVSVLVLGSSAQKQFLTLP